MTVRPCDRATARPCDRATVCVLVTTAGGALESGALSCDGVGACRERRTRRPFSKIDEMLTPVTGDSGADGLIFGRTVQRNPTPAAPAPFDAVPSRNDSPWPSGHLLIALVLFGLVGVLRVARAIDNREVFGFEATTALLALLLWPFVARDLFKPLVRSWRERRRARAASSVVAAASVPPRRSASAKIIRMTDRRPRRPE